MAQVDDVTMEVDPRCRQVDPVYISSLQSLLALVSTG